MELKTIRFEVEAGVATLTLARPHRMNAWTGRMHAEYRWALARAEADPCVRVVVVTGEGRGFCVGGDSQALEGHVEKGRYDPGTPEALARPGYGVRPEFDADFAYQLGIPLPIIAALNGPAAGVGLALACFCDLRLAARGVKLTTAHGRLGLPAEYGLSWILPRLVGLTRANDLLLRSRVVLAEEAAEMGLVNEVVEPEELPARSAELARELATRVSPASLRATKLQVHADLHRDAASAVRDSVERISRMMRGPDFRVGVEALRQRRAPDFSPGAGAGSRPEEPPGD